MFAEGGVSRDRPSIEGCGLERVVVVGHEAARDDPFLPGHLCPGLEVEGRLWAVVSFLEGLFRHDGPCVQEEERL